MKYLLTPGIILISLLNAHSQRSDSLMNRYLSTMIAITNSNYKELNKLESSFYSNVKLSFPNQTVNCNGEIPFGKICSAHKRKCHCQICVNAYYFAQKKVNYKYILKLEKLKIKYNKDILI